MPLRLMGVIKISYIFQARNGSYVKYEDIVKKLIEVDAHKCDVLYIHTDMSFGIPNPRLSRKELLRNILDAILELGVKTVCFPTFTFSFCNNKIFDLNASKTSMGALNEYVRLLPDSIRSIDPLMSIALIGEDKDLVNGIGLYSIGKDSTFDKLHQRRNVKFLFFGVNASKCFTYTHYIEEKISVPYRYNRQFTGMIIDNNESYTQTYNLFVRYKDVVPTTSNRFEQFLIDNKYMKIVDCGDSVISCVDEPIVYTTLNELIAEDINYMLEGPYPAILSKEFKVQNMVSL